MKNFSAAETEWMLELDGIELANFWQRAVAYLIDWIIIAVILSLFATVATGAYLGFLKATGRPMPQVVQMMQGKVKADKKDEDYVFTFGSGLQPGTKDEHGHIHMEKPPEENEAVHFVQNIVIAILYFGILLWRGKGQTPGKKIMKIRVVSIVHRHLTFWHCVERALGYGAAALELGFGFLQFFIHPYRRCAQDRLAETIVVTEAGYQAMQGKLEHPLIPDTTP